MRERPPEQWPHALVLLGDQVYADEVSPETLAFIRKRRDIRKPPGEEVADFEEYTRLYREAWSDPAIRWLLSTVSTSMVVDDHDIHDDWNISAAWVEDMRERGLVGRARVRRDSPPTGSISSSATSRPSSCARATCSRGSARPTTAGTRCASSPPTSAKFATARAGATAATSRATRLIVIDSRCGRVLEEGKRSILDEEEWEWLEEHLKGDYDHLLDRARPTRSCSRAGLTTPSAGARRSAPAPGATARRGSGEKLRRALDFDHWAAFGDSFERLMDLLERTAAGEFGEPPASITVLSGDVHHAYLAELGFKRSAGAQSAVWQAVCSPFRNALNGRERATIRFGNSRAGAAAQPRTLSRLAGVRRRAGPLAPGRGPLLRQPGRDPDARRAQRASSSSSARSAIPRRTTASCTRRSSARSPDQAQPDAAGDVDHLLEALALKDRGREAAALAAAAQGRDRAVARQL